MSGDEAASRLRIRDLEEGMRPREREIFHTSGTRTVTMTQQAARLSTELQARFIK